MSETSQALDSLIEQVRATETVEASAKVLIEGLAAQIAAVPPVADPNIIAGIVERMRSSADELAAAVAATPPPVLSPDAADTTEDTLPPGAVAGA